LADDIAKIISRIDVDYAPTIKSTKDTDFFLQNDWQATNRRKKLDIEGKI